ncbi:MAG: AMP-binding protein [Candidatus Sericytochromatia bacterium]
MTFPARPVTLCEAFQRTAAVDPGAVALRTLGNTQTMTWREYASEVGRVAAGLAALGVRRGDAVALMMDNRVEFYSYDVGAQHVGATSFSVYNSLSAEQLADVLDQSGARILICEEKYVERIMASGAEVKHIVCIDGAPAGCISAAELLAADNDDFDFEAAWRAVRADDVATLIFTSGTTGDPKCVEITHANLLFEAFALDEVLGVQFGDHAVSFLPSAHVADRMSALYVQEVFGAQVTTVSDPNMILAALAEVRPTIWAAVSRVWEMLKAQIECAARSEPDDTTRREVNWALSVATEYGAALASGGEVPEDVVADRLTADGLVLSKIRVGLGLDRLRWALCGDAAIPKETVGFFAALGVPISEVWGMSELTCVAAVSSPRDARCGTVGRLLPGLEGRLADDGEFWVRGPLLMKGYRNDPAKTAEVIDRDGWLHTGDIVRRDEDGFLRIVGRKTELVANAAGQKMSPAQIENTIKAACALIGAIAVIGDGRPYNTALIVLDQHAAGRCATCRSAPAPAIADLAADPLLIEQVAGGVAAGNANLLPAERVKRFRILPTYWEPGGDELTLTFKLRRGPISRKYNAEIDEMYESEPASSVHEPSGQAWVAQTAQSANGFRP